MNEYNKELERMIKHTIAYMIAERQEEISDADMSIVWEMISNNMYDESEDKV